MKTILILEDDVIFSRSIGNWLKKKGMATEHATTLSAARKALSAREFDLVLADLRLPDGNSTSLLEWMNERFYATPFLIMTNYGQVENAVEAMQLGAANYLCKPVQPDKLLEAIGKIFSRSRNDGSEFYRGESAKAREMYRLVGLVARSDISVLIREPPVRERSISPANCMNKATVGTSLLSRWTAEPLPAILPNLNFWAPQGDVHRSLR